MFMIIYKSVAMLAQEFWCSSIACWLRAMARLTADALQEKYGEELARPPLSDAKTPRMLMKALLERIPPIVATDGIMKTWFQKYRLPPGAIRISSAAELEATYGDEVRTLQKKYRTVFVFSCCCNYICFLDLIWILVIERFSFSFVFDMFGSL